MAAVAICGSRDYPDLDAVRAYVATLPADTVVVSGAARGVDREAAREARRRGLTVIEYRPDWTTMGKRAGMVRNVAIVDHADRIVAFWDGVSKGTANTIERARRTGKPVEIRTPRGETP